jgi:tetratricopeptide (TPR) repeat protein
MAYPVFISYARDTSKANALALRDGLVADGVDVFLDDKDIPAGAQFPDELAAAIHATKVVVVFADEMYFSRPWCVREFEAATAGPDAPAVVVAAPAVGGVAGVFLFLPPVLARRAWPPPDQTATIVAMVRRALDGARDRNLALPEESPLLPEGIPLPQPWPEPLAPLVAGIPATLGERFVGRGELLWRTFFALEAQRAGGVARRILLSGGGGTGKSQLAAELAHRYGPHHYAAVVWLDADVTEEEYVAQLRHVLAALGVQQTHDRREGLMAQIAAAIARLAGDRPVLWIVDDLPEPAAGQAPSPLSHWCPSGPRLSVLITSRRAKLVEADATVSVDALAPDDAVRMLTQPAVDRRWLPDGQWRAVARWVGELPLVLRILQCGLSDGSIRAAALAAQAANEEPARVVDAELEALRESVPDGALRGVAAAFGASYEALAASASARALLDCVALLPPWSLDDEWLGSLAGAREVGALSRRGWLQSSTGTRGRRVWRLHRVAASYVRSRADLPKTLLGVVASLERALAAPAMSEETADEWARLLGSLGDRIIAVVHHQRGPDADALEAAAEQQAVAAAFYRLRESRLRGLRAVAAGLGRRLLAWNLVVERARAVIAGNEEAAIAALPHMLQAFGPVQPVADLVADLLKDPRDSVRHQAIVHATSYRADRIAGPWWQAVINEPDPQHFVTSAQIFLEEGGDMLAQLTAVWLKSLGAPGAGERAAAAHALKEVLYFHGVSAKARAVDAAAVRRALVDAALGDPDESVVIAAGEALGQYHDEASHHALAAAIENAGDEAVRLRAIVALGAYLDRVDAPPRPTAQVVIDDDGRMFLQGQIGKSPPPRPELALPLANLSLQADAAGELALRQLVSTPSGKYLLMDAVEGLHRKGEFAFIEAYAERALRIAPEFSSPYWWRARARDAAGNVVDAIADYRKVVELAPAHGYSWLRIAQLELHRGDRTAARAAVQAASKLLPADDAELAPLQAQLAVDG